VLTIALAATSLGAHSIGAANSALIGGATSIGLMAAVNFTIDSLPVPHDATARTHNSDLCVWR